MSCFDCFCANNDEPVTGSGKKTPFQFIQGDALDTTGKKNVKKNVKERAENKAGGKWILQASTNAARAAVSATAALMLVEYLRSSIVYRPQIFQIKTRDSGFSALSR